ncbi:MAG: energy transducer TonB [Bacteroidales bacterium]
MKPKKVKKVNLENKKFLFFELGLIVSLAIALLAFEWGTKNQQSALILVTDYNNWDDEDVINTFTKQELPPEVKPPEIFELIIKGNNEDVEGYVFTPTEIPEWGGVKPPEIVEKPEVFPFWRCEDKPLFMNGTLDDFVRYIQSTVIFPEEALRMNIQGRVYASFVVNKYGKIEDIKILRGVDRLLDDEVIKALKASPGWTPGKQRGMPVSVSYTIPVVFRISN